MTKMKVALITVLSIFIVSIVICSAKAQAEKKLSPADGGEIYRRYCTPCHGLKGDGKGFNAKNLDPRPANHTDKEFMSRKADKELYDAVRGGGKAVGKATLMPPWGNTFDEAQIKSLVLYLRELCRCEGE